MEDIKYWIWFSRLENLSPKFMLKLLEKYKTPRVIWNKNKNDFLNEKISKKQIKELLNKKYKQNINKYIEYMQKNNIGLITILDEEYPDILKTIYDPPVVLFYKGNKEILKEKAISIVGCRKCTEYGKNVALDFSCKLAKQNFTIVSGLAEGIDSFSHIGALNANGKTIAVVGCGLDRVYPEKNKWLFNKIIENDGLIVSEYIIGTKPLAQNFPKRNRIISGLAKKVIVVEAKEKSGTLITVDCALEQGRDVYCVPGSIYSQNSYGTNELIKNGASVLTNLNDIL